MVIRIARQFGQCIRARRIALGWTQDELARRAHVSRSTVYRLEAGTTTSLYPGKLLEVLDALGLEVSVDLRPDASRDAEAGAHGDAGGQTGVDAPSCPAEAAQQVGPGLDSYPGPDPDPTLDFKPGALADLLAMGDAYKDYAAKLRAKDAAAPLGSEGDQRQ